MKFIEPIVALIAWVFTKVVEVITTRLYTSKIIFNTVWEDPRVDLQALNLSPEDVMVNISSAGDHTLEFAAQGMFSGNVGATPKRQRIGFCFPAHFLLGSRSWIPCSIFRICVTMIGCSLFATFCSHLLRV